GPQTVHLPCSLAPGKMLRDLVVSSLEQKLPKKFAWDFLQTRPLPEILPSERCFRRHACLLRRPKKVPADLRNIFAVRKKFAQARMPFETSAKSFRSHQHLFRDREVFCSAPPKLEHR